MGYFNFENSPSKKTPISAENLLAMQKGLMELAFPIGSTYITQSDTNPNTILNFGTWERLKGKVCVGLDEDDTNMNTIGKTGGEKEHTLTINEMPEHMHDMIDNDPGYYAGWGSRSGWAQAAAQSDSGGRFRTDLSGGNEPHNNLQPYEVVGYMWIRRS